MGLRDAGLILGGAGSSRGGVTLPALGARFVVVASPVVVGQRRCCVDEGLKVAWGIGARPGLVVAVAVEAEAAWRIVSQEVLQDSEEGRNAVRALRVVPV